jgi:anti-sigma B factor antagonist
MASEYLITKINKACVVEFRIPSLMDPVVIETIQNGLGRLVDEEDQRLLILDFSRVEFISSQAIGFIISLSKKLGALPNSKFLLCGINEKLMQLLKITRLDRILKIKPTQTEAINSLAMV